jgi:hypothetical protein
MDSRMRRQYELRITATDRERKGCAGKTRLTSKSIASARARILTEEYGVLWNAYRCRLCKGWHIGHDRRDETVAS